MDDIDTVKALLEQLNERISALEHTVNDVIIEGWKKADAEYTDNENYNAFNTKYGEKLNAFSPYFHKLYGDDFDLNRSLYDELKQTEGPQDELMEAKLKELEDKFKDWKLESPAQETVVVEPEDDKYNELKSIYKEYIGE